MLYITHHKRSKQKVESRYLNPKIYQMSRTETQTLPAKVWIVSFEKKVKYAYQELPHSEDTAFPYSLKEEKERKRQDD
jgi:hypothetical protein